MLCECILFIVGFCYLARISLELLNIILGIFEWGNDYTFQPDTWAIITACTDGFGLGFAEELAKKGFNIVQIGRNPSKLNKSAQSLKDKYNIQVVNIEYDFYNCPKDPILFYNKVSSQIKDLDIGVLVNNVGVGHVKEFLYSEKNILHMLALNIFPIVFMTKAFLEKTYLRKQTGIINVSSISAVCPLQNLSVYSSCKAFDLIFSLVFSLDMNIQNKCTGSNVEVLCIQPSLIESPATQYIKEKPMILTKNACAKKTIDLLGKRVYSSGHWKHAVMYVVMNFCSVLVPICGKKFSKPYEY
ncbi:hypothetical protein SteCoe_27736 [Stentor coeruleus]|uniref:Uncharacterized protein n=1 Tax=Stentor coeruleus TaxID=5963 RepID=A0A1R2B9U9_9CILI|nr:hypothetical protein SteCoe_27736 [Stentor coeruleus]